MNPIYRDLVLARIKGAVASAKAVAAVEHQGLKGQIREVLIRDLFRPLLPADIGVCSGEIISFCGKRQSHQQDIIIFNQAILPPCAL
jgi:hypothetical protein